MLRSIFLLTAVSICSTVIFAASVDTTSFEKRNVGKRAVCTPASLGDTQKDDTVGIKAAITSCGNGGTIIIPSGKIYSLRTMLDFTGCVKCDFQIEGTLKASGDTDYWATQPAMLYVNKISGVSIRSLTGTGVIDGNGQNAYDIFAVDTTLKRPTLLLVSGGSKINVKGLTIKNPPNVFIAQKGGAADVNYSDLTMTAISKSANAPKNTDGFDIGESTYTTIKNIYVSNQDDCIAFKSGCNYVNVNKITCAGTNHGLSVGSLGKANADSVQNVYVTGATMINCTKAVGIKLYPSGPAYGTSAVSNVTWDGVTVDNCEYGAQVQSCYGTTVAECAANPCAASLTSISFKNFKGTTNAKKAPAVANLNCPLAGTCGLHFKNFNIAPPTGTAVALCANTQGDIGVTCTAGASG